MIKTLESADMRNVGVFKYSGAKDRVHVYGGSGGGGAHSNGPDHIPPPRRGLRQNQ